MGLLEEVERALGELPLECRTEIRELPGGRLTGQLVCGEVSEEEARTSNPGNPGFERLKRLTSHVGYARWLAETEEEPVGYIKRVPEIPSPYRYAPVHEVLKWKGKDVIAVETDHKRYDIFEVPESVKVYADEEGAMIPGAVA